ncbi:MAG: tetratricopeptide repeat protein [Chloroflexota bacterium]
MTKCPHCGTEIEDSIETLIKRATQASQGRNYEAAVEFYRQVLRADGYHLQAHYGLGAALFEAKRYEEAIRAFQDALRLWPGASSLYQNIGIALKQLGRQQEAIEYFEKAVSLVDDDQLMQTGNRPAIKQAMQKELEALRPKKSGLKLW